MTIVKIVNVTPHAVRFQSGAGEVYEVAPSGTVINARPVEEPAGRHPAGAELVRVRFVAAPEGERKLAALEAGHPGAVIVGGLIAAQAFPGRIVALVPIPGFERVPPEQKRMRDDKFTVF